MDKPGIKKPVTLSRTEALCVRDSTVIASWNTSTADWHNYTKYEYGYDWLLNVNVQTIFGNFNSSWNPSGRNLITYNTHNDVTEQLYQSYSGSIWSDATKITNTYDAHYNLLSSLSEVWTSTNNQWRNQAEIVHTFDAQDNMTYKLDRHWDVNQSAWVNDDNSTYTYNSSNLMSTETQQTWTTSTNSWLNSLKDTYSYDIFNNLSGITEQMWNAATSSWVNSLKIVVTFSGSDMLSAVISDWDAASSTWVNSDKILYTYDSNHNMLSETDQVWDTGTNAWTNSYMYTNTYNNLNKPVSQLTQDWNTNTNAWQNIKRSSYTYDNNGNQLIVLEEDWTNNQWVNSQRTSDFFNCTTVGLSEQTKNSGFLKIYPNPAQSEFYVKTEKNYTSIRVLDISGKEVVYSGENKNVISVSALENGIYFIQLLDQDRAILATDKFVKD